MQSLVTLLEIHRGTFCEDSPSALGTVSRDLRELETHGFISCPRDGEWTLTALGQDLVASLLGFASGKPVFKYFAVVLENDEGDHVAVLAQGPSVHTSSLHALDEVDLQGSPYDMCTDVRSVTKATLPLVMEAYHHEASDQSTW